MRELKRAIPPIVVQEMRDIYESINIANLSVDNICDKDHAVYTILHIEVIKDLCNKLGIKYFNMFHDYDKLAYYIVTDSDTAHRLHRATMKHHNHDILERDSIIEQILDWESAQYTKAGKSYTAYEYLLKKYSDSEAFQVFKKYLMELNLWRNFHRDVLTEEEYENMKKSVSDEKLLFYLKEGYAYLGMILNEISGGYECIKID